MGLLPVIDFDVSDNETWADFLDGRAIYFHRLWIEPANTERVNQITRRNERYVAPVPRSIAALGGSAAAVAAAVSAQPALARRSGEAGEPPVVCNLRDGALAVAGTPEHGAVSAALAVLAGAHMRFLVDLAAGVVVQAAQPTDPTPDVLYVADLAGDPGAIAHRLLDAAAECWVSQWLWAERNAGIRDEPLAPPQHRWLVSMLAESFNHRLRDLRSGAAAPAGLEPVGRIARGSQLAAGLDEVAGLTPVAELVAFMYPHWNRRQFATKSPFDYMRTLAPLTQDEIREHRRRWSDPAAVR
ncbi:hypothetical protein GCM10010124_06120 [Pilimelia terevasa]|uniref:Uncharacterized protein n=1 Tax=Pilimelia terevasa TaxID=53372 RepID=A0A8J3FHY5_9ACTN|nr:hypothetical protein [Pilimelia terevasa]GGK16312.1 hypothetical protein GCM10010124_06120 [Pilimelia terevasa]